MLSPYASGDVVRLKNTTPHPIEELFFFTLIELKGKRIGDGMSWGSDAVKKKLPHPERRNQEHRYVAHPFHILLFYWPPDSHLGATISWAWFRRMPSSLSPKKTAKVNV